LLGLGLLLIQLSYLQRTSVRRKACLSRTLQEKRLDLPIYERRLIGVRELLQELPASGFIKARPGFDQGPEFSQVLSLFLSLLAVVAF